MILVEKATREIPRIVGIAARNYMEMGRINLKNQQSLTEGLSLQRLSSLDY